jgi:hypothetical protein
MGSLAVVEEADRPAGLPEWIARSLNVKPGRDPIGLQTITLDRIMPILLPGILVLSRRARYFTFFPFLLQTFRELQLPASNDVLSEFIKLREFELACAVHLCPNGCGDSSSGAVGSSRAGPAVRGQHEDAIARRESVESYLGGYGLYYRSPLVDLGLVVPKGTVLASETVTPVDVLHPDGRADALADAFREAIADTAYYREWMLGEEPIPLEVLTEFAERACFCRLTEAPGEQALIRQAFFEPPSGEQPAFVRRDVGQRRRSFALFLREMERRPEAAASDAAFREAVWTDFVSTAPTDEPLPRTLAQWAALVAKEYLQEGLSSLFAHFWRLGLQRGGSDGLSVEEVEALLRGPLLGEHAVEVCGKKIEVDGTMPASSFAATVAEVTAAAPFEVLREFAIEQDSAIAGLVLILASLSRLPQRERAVRDWQEIGLQSSERQPSLLGLAHLIEEHLRDEPTLAETLAWLTRRLVIWAHEQIAYSKLPDFTFRFRHEGGRLRFYKIGDGRFELADMRRGSMAQLSEDVGLWEQTESGPELSELGRAFVAEVFA